MYHVLKRRDQRRGAIASVEFEGGPYGAGISFFQGNLSPGRGPGLHRHPYPEVCIVLSGQAAIVVDGNEVVAGPDDIVVIGPGTPHRFAAIGEERLDMVCVHASERIVIEGLEEERAVVAAFRGSAESEQRREQKGHHGRPGGKDVQVGSLPLEQS